MCTVEFSLQIVMSRLREDLYLYLYLYLYYKFKSKLVLLLCDLSLDLPPLCHSCQQMRVKDPTRQTRAKRHEMNTTALLHCCYLPLVMLPFHKSPSLSISKLSVLQNPVTIFSEEFTDLRTDLVSQRVWVYESCIFSRYLGFHSSWPDITVFSWTCVLLNSLRVTKSK